MGLIDTYNRWKQIVLNTKLNRKRVLNLEKNLQNNLAREYPSLENESISFKSKIRVTMAALCCVHLLWGQLTLTNDNNRILLTG